MIANSSANGFRKAFATDVTPGGTTFTEPSDFKYRVAGNVQVEPQLTDGMWQVASGPVGGVVENFIHVLPIGTGGDNKTFVMRVYGWRPMETSDKTIYLLPFLLIEVNCTTSNSLTAATWVTSGYFCDTVALSTGDPSARFYSPANNSRGGFAVDLLGSSYVSFLFAQGASSSATNVNALWSKCS